MDNGSLRGIAAAQVIIACSNGNVDSRLTSGASAKELNALVATYPPPEVSMERLGLDAGSTPVLFVDMDFGGVIQLLGGWTSVVGAPFPVFYMPVDAMQTWDQAEGVPEFFIWLKDRGLDLQLNVGGSATWLKGHWVMLVDVRLRFLEDVPPEALQIGMVEVLQITQEEG